MISDYTKEIKSLTELDIKYEMENVFITIQQINICVFTPGFYYDFHVHSFYEFHYIKEGKGMVSLNGIEYDLKANSFYVTGPGIVHKQVADLQDPMVEYAVSYDLKLINEIEKLGYKVAEETTFMLDVLTNKSARVVHDKFGVDELFEKLLSEIHLKNACYFTQIKNILFQIIISAVRNFSSRDADFYSIPKRHINEHRISLLNNFIADNYNRSIGLSELANYLFLSSRQLERVVRSQTGLSVHEYVLSFRIKEVKKLLRTSHLKLNSIAEQTGFSNEFHLSNTFKKITGESPSEYKVNSNRNV